ncbi:Quinolinate synthetase A protein, partial [Musa troglodytarum]
MVKPMKKETVALIQRGCDRKKAVEGGSGMSGVKPVLLLRRERTFGQVLECWDREREEMVAIKIVRGINKYREAAMIEINMLQQLGKYDKNASRWCILAVVCKYWNWFDYRNHICIVSSRSPKQGSYFKRLPKSSAIKVIDFGSTTYDRCDNSYVVSTRHYRAPEGETLFQTHENLEHLAMMERVLGPLPSNMLRLAARDAERYVRRGQSGDAAHGSFSWGIHRSFTGASEIRPCKPIGSKRSSLASFLHKKLLTPLLLTISRFSPPPNAFVGGRGPSPCAASRPRPTLPYSAVASDRAVKMAEAGCKCITVLGVDFMSENVRAILDQADFKEAFAQVPDLNVWYGPDSYMGANIVELFHQMADMTDEEISGIHPEHNRNSIRSLLKRLHYYQEALDRDTDDHLQFVLGTESGMLTSIVAAVRGLLGSREFRCKIKVEIAFPVSSDSVSRTSVNGSQGPNSAVPSDITELAVVPGVATGEGCSIHGATSQQRPAPRAYEANRFNAVTPGGKPVVDIGCEPILHEALL